MIDELITELRADLQNLDDPQAKALFEVSSEVRGGLQRAFEHYENQSEEAWR